MEQLSPEKPESILPVGLEVPQLSKEGTEDGEKGGENQLDTSSSTPEAVEEKTGTEPPVAETGLHIMEAGASEEKIKEVEPVEPEQTIDRSMDSSMDRLDTKDGEKEEQMVNEQVEKEEKEPFGLFKRLKESILGQKNNEQEQEEE